MPSFVRITKITLSTIAGLTLWGASVACETDAWSSQRVEYAPSGTQASDAKQLPSVAQGAQSETDLTHEMMLHRAMYARFLNVLVDYYTSHGYEQKANWARIELRDLRQVRGYGDTTPSIKRFPRRTHNAAIEEPQGVELPNIQIANRVEVDVVEEMMLHRSMYQRYLNLLGTYYSEKGQENNANVVRSEINDLRTIKTYQYITDTETPSTPLKPLESIAEADQLFVQGQKLMSKGGHHIIIYYNNTTMKEALNTFKELVDKYPTSDKIDDAAYFIAEIHKEYNQERDNEIAIEWYKKAIAWNPDLDYPAWSHIAHIYDFRMHEREKALHWYQLVLEHEKDKHGWRFAKNIDVANKRIGELTGVDTRHSPADLAGETDKPVGGTPTASPMPQTPATPEEQEPATNQPKPRSTPSAWPQVP